MDRDIASETQAYQVILEGRRAHPHDTALANELVQAKTALDIAWLQHTSNTSPTGRAPALSSSVAAN
jgi:hypothetical protein